MTFGMAQLRTCKELLKISKAPRYMEGAYNSFEGKIFVRFGRFYATNAFALVCVEWDDYQHAGDEEWCELSRFMDNEGKLIKFEFEPSERQFSNDFFERQFMNRVNFADLLPVNPKLLASVLKIFEVNDLMPIMVQDGTKWQLSAHNKDVNIKAIVMGIRRNS